MPATRVDLMIAIMKPEPYVVELDPCTKTTLKMYLFKNVQNLEVIRNNIIHGVWSCAAIKANLIIDPFQVAVAANKAVVSEKQNAMVTKTVFSEILYNLSISKNITQSLNRFGIDKDVHLLICFLVTEQWDAIKEILPHIQGEPCSMSVLKELTCMKNVSNFYKLKNENHEELVNVVVSKMVTKNFVTH